MANIRDVAKLANVSVATVSHVINRSRYVSPALIRVVEDAINTLGYIPQRQGSSGYKMRNILLLVQDFSDFRCGPVADGISEMLADTAYDLSIRQICGDSVDPALVKSGCDGIIVFCGDGRRPQHKGNAPANILYIDANSCTDADRVAVDREAGAYHLASYLIRNGHEKILLIMNGQREAHNKDILTGFQRAYTQHELTFHDELIREIVPESGDAAQICREIHSTAVDATALFLCDQLLLERFLLLLSDLPILIPNDISVVCLENPPWASLVTPPITGMDLRLREIGRAAGKLLLERMDNPDKENGALTITPELVLRKSAATIYRGPLGERANGYDSLELSESEILALRSRQNTAALCFHGSDRQWMRQHENGIRDCFQSMGIEVLSVSNALFDASIQMKQHDSVLMLDPDIIISNPADEILLADSYRKLVESRAELVLIDGFPKGLKSGDYVSCISTNEREHGKNVANLIGEYFQTNGKKNIALVNGNHNSIFLRQRNFSVKQVLLEEFPSLCIVAEASFRYESEAQDIVVQTVEQHPEIEGIYVSWDVPAINAMKALESIDRQDIAVFTTNLDIETGESMAMRGMIKGVSAQRAYEQGRAVALVAANALLGKKVPSFICVSPYRVTRDNLETAWCDLLKEPLPETMRDLLSRDRYLG